MRLILTCLLLLFFGIACHDINDAKPKKSDISLTDNTMKAAPEAADIAPPTGAPSGPSLPPIGPSLPPTAGANGEPSDTPHNNINGWVNTDTDRLSTFAADVDTGSFTLAHATLNTGSLPEPTQVRIEEFLNYFPYNYPQPQEGDIFSVTLDSAPSPFAEDATILRVGIKGKELTNAMRKKVNLIFLTDVSGSMQGPTRLDLAKSAMEALVNSLNPEDKIAIVTYASSSKVVLPLTSMTDRAAILDGIYSLQAEGATAMGAGINLAYGEAVKALSADSITRIVVLSDGDANVGSTSPEEILAMIADKAKRGIYLTTAGFGMGNYRDDMMEKLADKGNGNYYYVDSITEAKRVFQAEVTGTLDVIAKDLKIQVDFDPQKVVSYRILGFENRDIADDDFRNDEVDAGELGPGHRVTALYEVKLNGAPQNGMAMVRLRFKNPQANDEVVEKDYDYLSQSDYSTREAMPHDFRVALIASGFAEVLRGSPFCGRANLEAIEAEATSIMNEENALEVELLTLIKKAQGILKQ